MTRAVAITGREYRTDLVRGHQRALRPLPGMFGWPHVGTFPGCRCRWFGCAVAVESVAASGPDAGPARKKWCCRDQRAPVTGRRRCRVTTAVTAIAMAKR